LLFVSQLLNLESMNLGFLASHGGSNMQAIIDKCRGGQIPANPALLICNNPGATAVKRARDLQVTVRILNGKTHPNPDELDRAMKSALLEAEVDLVILAGYMKKIGPATLVAFSNRILNIHPSLLPKFGGRGMYGIRVHEAVISTGETESGATVHLIDSGYDKGQILRQSKIVVAASDTPESLQKRILEIEHDLYPETIAAIAKGSIDLPVNAP